MNWHKFVNDIHCSQKMYPRDFVHSLTSDQLCRHIHFIWEHLIFWMKLLVYIMSYIFSLSPDDKGLGPDIHGSCWRHQQIAIFFFFDGLALNLVQMPWNFLSFHQHVIVFVQFTYPVKYLKIWSPEAVSSVVGWFSDFPYFHHRYVDILVFYGSTSSFE